jgi:ATP-dependent 26S proteasome regulatory subunit
VNDLHDLTLILKSRFPIVVIETHEEPRAQALLERIANLEQWPLWTWSVTQGLKRYMVSESPVYETKELTAALRNIEASPTLGLYVLMDADPFLQDPVNLRLIKEIALGYHKVARTLVLVGHKIELPADLKRMSASFNLSMPGAEQVRKILSEEVQLWQQSNGGARLKGDPQAANMLVQHLVGMSADDARRLLRQSIRDDGMVTMDDIERVLKLKHQAMTGAGMLDLELDCGSFADVGGQKNLKRWLELRRNVFLNPQAGNGLDVPKGILLLGVQGAGKSLAAKAVAGSWGLPLLRLDFASLYNKFHGETERNLRESLKMAEVMEPCVLWIDEIEKGLAPDGGSSDGGVSRRVLGTLLTWMTERKSRIFLAATANDISQLPPELLRKGRFDEIFFVDLPEQDVREDIFRIHLKRRQLDPKAFDVPSLAVAAEGFSGAEIEQSIVAAMYEAQARNEALASTHILEEAARTRPLSVVMAEKIAELRAWAAERTVPAN